MGTNKLPAIDDAELSNELIAMFESGTSKKTGRDSCLAKLREKYSMGTDRYLRQYDIDFEQWKTIKSNARSIGITRNTIADIAEHGDKKQQHIIDIENEIESIKQLLAVGYIVKRVTFPKRTTDPNEKAETVEKKEVFGAREITLLNNLIDSKRAELFKLDGMYSPTKSIVGGDKNNPIFPQPAFDYSKLSFDELETLKMLNEKCMVSEIIK